LIKCESLGGLGDKDESFVELMHKYGARNERRLNCVASYEAKHNIILKTVQFGTLPDIMKKKVEHANKSKCKEAPVAKTKPDAKIKTTGLALQSVKLHGRPTMRREQSSENVFWQGV
jgi:hypothetical protein